ncbi:MAG: DUF5060 domain-containing protein [Planctomycetota bacterium]
MNSFLRCLSLFVLLISCGDVFGEDGPVQQTEATRQWEMAELELMVSSTLPEPIDADVAVQFRHGSGKQISVPGFFDGNNEYKVRFTPPLPGTWQYSVESSLSELNGRSGALNVMTASRSQRGGVVIDPNASDRLAFQNGESYFPIAFECDWLFALDALNADDIPATRKFVDQLASSGFNQVVLNVFAYDVKWPKDPSLRPEHDFGSPSVFPFGGSNESPDHSQLNVTYFQRLDRVLHALIERGIIAHLMIYVWNKRVNWPEANSREDNRYFDYVVKRYQAYPNVIWDISKEALGYGHNDVNYITNRIHRLREDDAHERLITVHDYGYCRRFPNQVDFVSVQLWASELYGVMRNTVERFPGKPILNIEHGGYERSPYRVFVGDYTSPETCLERAYQCVFAGTYPTHYWQGAAWNVIIADTESLPPSDRPQLGYYRHLADLVERYRLNDLIAGKKLSNSGFCLTDDERLFVFYVPKENDSMNLRLPKDLRGRMMTGIWVDPFTGKSLPPVRQEVVQWPTLDVPASLSEFAILVIEVDEAKQAEERE